MIAISSREDFRRSPFRPSSKENLLHRRYYGKNGDDGRNGGSALSENRREEVSAAVALLSLTPPTAGKDRVSVGTSGTSPATPAVVGYSRGSAFAPLSRFHSSPQTFPDWKFETSPSYSHHHLPLPRTNCAATVYRPRMTLIHHQHPHLPTVVTCDSSMSMEVDSAAESCSTSLQSSQVANGYYSGCTSLALKEDDQFLSPLHCFMRKYCVEAFSATEEDASEPRYGGPHSGRDVHQVGIRCIHCKHRPPSERRERAVCFPSTLKNIYHSIETWQRRHSLVCQDIPVWVKKSITELMQRSRSGAGGRRQYWEDSARRVGMVDTDNGIRFIRPPGFDASGSIGNTPLLISSTDTVESTSPSRILLDADEPGRPVVQPEDQDLVTEFLFVLLGQMETCPGGFSEEDRVGGRSKVKNCPFGLPGIRCRHCSGKAGFGRYFPTSVVALTSANSDRNIYNHLLKCRSCPQHVQDRLVRLRDEQHMQPHRLKDKKGTKNRRGSRKKFFQQIWERMHDD